MFMTGNSRKSIAVAILLAASIASAQTPPSRTAALGSELDSLEARYRRAAETTGILSRRADSLAAQIQQRKIRKSSNLLSERALADELRRSQELANRLQAAQQIQAVQLDSLIQKAEYTLKVLNSEVTSLTVQLSVAKMYGDANQQKDLTAALREAYRLRQHCQALLKNAPAPAPLIEVRVHPHDSPETLAEKSDFLLDQADRLHRNAKQAEDRSNELRQEASVRERMADFVQDLRVFDPSAETPRAAGEAGVLTAAAPAEGLGQRTDFKEGMINPSQAVLTAQDFWPAAATQLSDHELRKWIARLEGQRRRWMAQADSLTQRSLEIRKLISSQPDER